MTTKRKTTKRVSAKTMCRKTVGVPGINKRTGQLLKGWKYVKGVPTKVTTPKRKKRGLGSVYEPVGRGEVCKRTNPDGSTTTYSSHGGRNPCPAGGTVQNPTPRTVSLNGPRGKKPKKKTTAAQSAARKDFAVKAKKAAALVKSGKAKNIKAAWVQLKKK